MNQDPEIARGACAAFPRGDIPAAKVAPFSQHADTELSRRPLR